MEAACPSCAASLAVTNGVRDRFPELEVVVIDLAREPRPEGIITAMLTFILDGKIRLAEQPIAIRAERVIADLIGGAS